MKRSRLFLISSLAMFLGLGVAAGVSFKKEAPVERAEAEAISGNVFRLTLSTDDWESGVYAYAYGGNVSMNWPGVSLGYSYNGSSQKVYTYSNSNMPTNIIFHNNRTDNGKGRRATVSCSSSNKAWYITGNAGTWTDGQLNMNTSTWTASNITYYFYDYKNIFGSSVKCYAWQSNGSLYNAAYPGASLTAVQYGSGQLYSISLDCAFDEFKIGTGDSANTGDVWINQKTGQCFCWWDTGDSSWSNDLDWVKGHDWIYQTMHMRDISQETTTDTGACKGSSGYYNKAKTAYQSFSDGIKTKISQDDLWGATQTRFAAWARANGETASFSGTTLSVNSNIINLMNGITENFDSTIIIVVISSISAIAIGGFFFLRKKKTSK